MAILSIYLSKEIFDWVHKQAGLEGLTAGRYAQRTLIKAMNVWSKDPVGSVSDSLDSFDRIMGRINLREKGTQFKQHWVDRFNTLLEVADDSQKLKIKQNLKLLNLGVKK